MVCLELLRPLIGGTVKAISVLYDDIKCTLTDFLWYFLENRGIVRTQYLYKLVVTRELSYTLLPNDSVTNIKGRNPFRRRR